MGLPRYGKKSVQDWRCKGGRRPGSIQQERQPNPETGDTREYDALTQYSRRDSQTPRLAIQGSTTPRLNTAGETAKPRDWRYKGLRRQDSIQQERQPNPETGEASEDGALTQYSRRDSQTPRLAIQGSMTP